MFCMTQYLKTARGIYAGKSWLLFSFEFIELIEHTQLLLIVHYILLQGTSIFFFLKPILKVKVNVKLVLNLKKK